jgi:hypothetical protein
MRGFNPEFGQAIRNPWWPITKLVGSQHLGALASHGLDWSKTMSDSDASQYRCPTFEETYPRYEFSELVRIGILIGVWVSGLRRTGRIGAWRAWLELRREKRPAARAS